MRGSTFWRALSPGEDRVLDAGCGDGYLARVLAMRGAHVAACGQRASRKTYCYHRTLENYLDAFLTAGLHLTKLADVPDMASTAGSGTILPQGVSFPRFMLTAFTKP